MLVARGAQRAQGGLGGPELGLHRRDFDDRLERLRAQGCPAVNARGSGASVQHQRAGGVGDDAVEAHAARHHARAQAEPELSQRNLQGGARHHGERERFDFPRRQREEPSHGVVVESCVRCGVHALQHEAARRVHGDAMPRCQSDLRPPCELGHCNELALDVALHERHLFKHYRLLCVGHWYWPYQGDGHAEALPEDGVRAGGARHHLRVMEGAGGDLCQLGPNAKSASVVREQERVRYREPRRGAVQGEPLLKRGAHRLVVHVLVHFWLDGASRLHGSAGPLVGLAHVQPAPAGVASTYRRRHLVSNVGSKGQVLQAPEGSSHLQKTVTVRALGVRLVRVQRQGRRLACAPQGSWTEFHVFLDGGGDHQCDTATHARRRHRGAVHEGAALQRPRGHGRDGSSRGAERYPQVAIGGGTA
mmetsp:Transcript_32940/g.63281  ORF Transcript_32940/g.63281 Transcript_32940/m.63281 type:complete len:419 (+) Transcript_32940:1654-2910(+)